MTRESNPMAAGSSRQSWIAAGIIASGITGFAVIAPEIGSGDYNTAPESQPSGNQPSTVMPRRAETFVSVSCANLLEYPTYEVAKVKPRNKAPKTTTNTVVIKFGCKQSQLTSDRPDPWQTPETVVNENKGFKILDNDKTYKIAFDVADGIEATYELTQSSIKNQPVDPTKQDVFRFIIRGINENLRDPEITKMS